MKLILTHEVSGLGTAGDVVDVKDGYARNFLFPRGLATPWTKGGEKQVDAIRKGREVREVKSLDEAKQIKGQLEADAVTVHGQGRSGRSPVRRRHPGDVAEAVKAAGGPQLDRRKIELPAADQVHGHARGAGAPAPRGPGQGEPLRRRRLRSPHRAGASSVLPQGCPKGPGSTWNRAPSSSAGRRSASRPYPCATTPRGCRLGGDGLSRGPHGGST